MISFNIGRFEIKTPLILALLNRSVDTDEVSNDLI
jgi:hypothetical protein